MINITSITGYDEVSDTLPLIAKQFREKPCRKHAYTDIMNVLTPRILKQNANVAGRKKAATTNEGERL